MSIIKHLAREELLWKRFKRKGVEAQNKHVQTEVDRMAESTAESRITAARSRAAVVHSKIDELSAEANLRAVTQPLVRTVTTLDDIPLYDFDSLFVVRDRLPRWLRDRVKIINAKINWRREDGNPGYFNAIAHHRTRPIPIPEELALLASLNACQADDPKDRCDVWIDAFIKCGLFVNARNGGRCQDPDCRLCNWVDPSRGLKLLLTSYDYSAFCRGGNWFAITVAPRTDPHLAQAVGCSIQEEDWDAANTESVVFRESHQPKEFCYGNVINTDWDYDFDVEELPRRFLGAVQATYGKLVKNCWLDGIRAKAEAAVDFDPFHAHWHSHATGSSTVEHDPQAMADFIKEEVDAILYQSCQGLYADVMVAAIPTRQDLGRWIKYANKVMDLLGPVKEFYARHPGVRRSDAAFKRLYEELRLYRQRIKRVFGMVRFSLLDIRGTHTYHLRRHYCLGTHRFGDRSILSEPQWHQKWRKKKALLQRERRDSKLITQSDDHDDIAA